MLIGEVAQLSGVSVRMLRHYDSTGLLIPSRRTPTGYRDYSPTDVHRLLTVEALRSLGMGLAEVATALDDPAVDVTAVLDRLRDETQARIDAEQDLLGHLDDLRDTYSAPTDSWDDVLRTTQLLSTLRSARAPDRQAAALQALPGQALGSLAASYLHEPDVNTAGTLRWSLVRAGEDAVAALLAAERDSHTLPDDPTPSHRVVEALSGIDGDAATAALHHHLHDMRSTVSARAALALAGRADGGAPDPEMVSRLISMVLAGDHDVDAADALADLCDVQPETDTAVVRKLVSAADSAEADARLRVVQALAGFSGDTAAAALHRFTRDPDTTVARTAQALSCPSTTGRRRRGR